MNKYFFKVMLCFVLCLLIFSNPVLANFNDNIAIIETNGSTKTPYYIHKDHLGGSSVVTDSNGDKHELTDYYPYGSTRLDEKTGTFENTHKFTGK